MTEQTNVYTVGNIVEARNKIEELERQGYLKENIYVLTHDKE
ncbi:MAG: Heat induced stress protein YflT [Bacilli bacterium]|nr:Heat induced stress protein YflT [Bacilli bacterium]